jgi:hypothetical protein
MKLASSPGEISLYCYLKDSKLKLNDAASALRLIGGFAGFTAILFWVTIGPVGNSAINQPLINIGSEIMVQVGFVDKTGFTQITL